LCGRRKLSTKVAHCIIIYVLFITSDNFNKIQELGVRKRRQIAQNPVRYKPNLQRFAGRFSCVFLGKVRCSKRGRGAHKRDGTNRKITAEIRPTAVVIFSAAVGRISAVIFASFRPKLPRYFLCYHTQYFLSSLQETTEKNIIHHSQNTNQSYEKILYNI
jgi:hypothetical protein